MTAPDDKIICLRCAHPNEPGATSCAWCGAPFTSATTTVKVSDLPKRSSSSQVPRLKTVGEGLSLLVAGEVRPVVLIIQDEIILGRHTETEPSSNIVDLTAYNAGLLGVSRKHAAISTREGHYTLQDLDSTNGTWLNEKQIPANTPFILRNGDQIRLGQLIVFIYFSSVSTEIGVTLRDTAFPQGSGKTLTMGYVGQRISPYLQAIISLQKILDQMMARTLSVVIIESVAVNARDARVNVLLSGGRDALQVVHDIITPWKQGQAAALAACRQSEALTPDQVAGLRNLVRPLALNIVQRHTPTGDDSILDSDVARLFPHLQVLVLSTLELEFQE